MSGSLKFGTSGLRALADELQGQAARRYVAAFLRYLDEAGRLGGRMVYLGRDFRASSPAIVADCAAAIAAHGLLLVDCGAIPTPALACHAMANRCAAIMVTGSHIPEDRNGLKFYGPDGEISKADEAGIVAALTDADVADSFAPPLNEETAAVERYLARFAGLLTSGTLAGWRIGVFEHASVARDMLKQVFSAAGAEMVSLGRSEQFVAVDTEAFGDAVFAPLKGWIEAERLDAIISADGDGDRPLLMDGRGQFVRGDVLGLLTAKFLDADAVVTPVTSNSAIEALFGRVLRTRVGSPYVIAGMEAAIAEGARQVIGFEANGGTLVGTAMAVDGAVLEALPTRDAVLPLLSVLALAARQGKSVAELVDSMPLRHAVSDRLAEIDEDKSCLFLERLASDQDYRQRFFAPRQIVRVAQIDGLQCWTEAGEMVHFRASGNAPELRCYVEARGAERRRRY